MTNAAIIMNEAINLVKAGVILANGPKIIVKNEDNEVVYEGPAPEQLFTFKQWIDRGYAVKKGQKAVASFAIWAPVSMKNRKKGKTDAKEEGKEGKEGKEENGEDAFFKKKAFFFTRSQVERIAKE